MTKIVFYLIFFISVCFADVWRAKESWDSKWEIKYSNWVKENWKQTVFTDEDSILSGLETDCADATYFMRAYFSFLYQLPFLATSSNGKIISEKMQIFDTITDDKQRFRKFLVYLADVTNTRTLANDTLPVAIDREYIKAGAIYLSPGIHSYQITDIDQYGIITTLSSTVPRERRVLFLNHGFPFYIPSDYKYEKDGFRVFKWPQDYQLSNSYQSRRSSEQFQIFKNVQGSYVEYHQIIIEKLKQKNEPLESKINRIYESLCYFSRERAVLVTQGYVRWLGRNKQCLAAADYEDYSTFIRDSRLFEYFNFFQSLKNDQSWDDLSTLSKTKFLSVFNESLSNYECKVETTWPQRPVLSLFQIRKNLVENKIVSDPNADIEQRWGFKKFEPKCLNF